MQLDAGAFKGEGGDPSSVRSITYLVANYNNARYLAHCLSSLRGQTDDGWTAIVADDASTDDSLEVIEAHTEPRIRVIRNKENIGYIGTLRRLIEEAPTDIVAILDSDDAIRPETTSALLAAYESGADVGFVYSRFSICDERGRETGVVHGSVIAPGGTSLWHGTVGHILSFRRSTYMRTAGLDESMVYAEDRDLVYKLEEVARPVFVDAALYMYRQTPGSQSRDHGRRALGARNTWRARRAALKRRALCLKGRLAWEPLLFADYVAYSNRFPPSFRRGATRAANGLGRILDQSRYRSGGL